MHRLGSKEGCKVEKLLFENVYYTCPPSFPQTTAPSPPAPSPSAPKDSTMCILPECNKAKCKDPNGTVHPYCGKTHAEIGKTRGIVRKLKLNLQLLE